MKTLLSAVSLLIILNVGCKKNNGNQNDNNPGAQKPLGPYSIYSQENCRGTIEGLAADYTYGEAGKKIVFSASYQPSDVWVPEFYLLKAAAGEYIVYSIEKHNVDTTYWVWYEPDEIITGCHFSTSGCGSVKLEAFKTLANATANKYRYKFDPENAAGTAIQTPGGRYLYTGQGKEKSNGDCNRLAAMFTASTAPCKEISEGEKIWNWCFKNIWFFRK